MKKYLFLFAFVYRFFPLGIYAQYLFDAVGNQTTNRKYLLQLIRRRSKEDQNNASLQRALCFDK